jgi:hypothetical protein
MFRKITKKNLTGFALACQVCVMEFFLDKKICEIGIENWRGAWGANLRDWSEKV